MNINQLESFKLSDAIKFHDELNPKLWSSNRLRTEVRTQLKTIAEDFLEELGISGLDVVDLTISGSNAAYSYTPHSDIDLHILIDMNQLDNDEIYRELFNAKRTVFNDSHDIKIRGIPVELYVQDMSEPHVSLGEYSVLQNRWLKFPIKRRANFDQTTTKAKYDKLHEMVMYALKSRNLKIVNTVIKKIRQYRKAGLERAGEFSPENLAYKALRNQQYITKLYDLKNKLHSDELTIETMYSQPESTKLLDRPALSVRKIAAKHNLTVKEILKQLVKGIEVEKKHTTYIQTAREVALDHLSDDPNYYKNLKQVKLQEEEKIELPNKVYFVTKVDKLDSILRQGLKPDQSEKKINCFPDKNSMQKALQGWLGKELNINDKIALIEIDTSGLEGEIDKGEKYEAVITSKVPTSSIKVLSKNLALPISESSGYIPSEKEKNDPRFKTALTVDVRPDAIKKNAKAFGFKVNRAGIPPSLREENIEGVPNDISKKTKKEYDEDYDPNGPPPGPEFKPTMPKGTVRVDVSDVYDWYKLGQHISNLKGLGKHDFGKGPPSTILSFGDEDTEHEYIKDLEKTGLETTDIDPVDPNQPKGMKRQKVDPTFNVNEKTDKY